MPQYCSGTTLGRTGINRAHRAQGPRGPGPRGAQNGPEGPVRAIQEIFPDSWVCGSRFWPSRMPSEAYVSRYGGFRTFEFLSRGQRQVFRRSRQCFFEIETRGVFKTFFLAF